MTDQTVESIYLEADANGDGRIGVTEAIMIPRKLGDVYCIDKENPTFWSYYQEFSKCLIIRMDRQKWS